MAEEAEEERTACQRALEGWNKGARWVSDPVRSRVINELLSMLLAALNIPPPRGRRSEVTGSGGTTGVRPADLLRTLEGYTGARNHTLIKEGTGELAIPLPHADDAWVADSLAEMRSQPRTERETKVLVATK